MSRDCKGLGAAVEDGVGSNLTQPSGIPYFSIYSFSISCISNDPGPEFFVEVCLNLRYIQVCFQCIAQ